MSVRMMNENHMEMGRRGHKDTAGSPWPEKLGTGEPPHHWIVVAGGTMSAADFLMRPPGGEEGAKPKRAIWTGRRGHSILPPTQRLSGMTKGKAVGSTATWHPHRGDEGSRDIVP